MRTAGENESVYCDRFSLASLNYFTLTVRQHLSHFPSPKPFVCCGCRLLMSCETGPNPVIVNGMLMLSLELCVCARSTKPTSRFVGFPSLSKHFIQCRLFCSVLTLVVVFEYIHTQCRSYLLKWVRRAQETSRQFTSIMLTVQMPSQKLIIETLSYAKELERIV